MKSTEDSGNNRIVCCGHRYASTKTRMFSVPRASGYPPQLAARLGIGSYIPSNARNHALSIRIGVLQHRLCWSPFVVVGTGPVLDKAFAGLWEPVAEASEGLRLGVLGLSCVHFTFSQRIVCPFVFVPIEERPLDKRCHTPRREECELHSVGADILVRKDWQRKMRSPLHIMAMEYQTICSR